MQVLITYYFPDIGTYDFIIVGSGSTGSVIARRLSELNDSTVLLLEAGSFGDEVTEITGMAYISTIMSDYNWGYYSVPQNHSCFGEYVFCKINVIWWKIKMIIRGIPIRT